MAVMMCTSLRAEVYRPGGGWLQAFTLFAIMQGLFQYRKRFSEWGRKEPFGSGNSRAGPTLNALHVGGHVKSPEALGPFTLRCLTIT